jgi:hypothetical protein
MNPRAWRRLSLERGPLYVSATLVVVGMAYSLWWAPLVRHGSYWVTPQDLWGGFLAAVHTSHGQFGQIYSPSTGFVSFPGLVFLLTPVAAICDSFRLGSEIPGAPVAHPSAWLILGPVSLVLSSVAIFACDSMAKRLRVNSARRVGLAIAEGVVLWNVAVIWGHPEDAIATGLALYALQCGIDDRWRHAGWLFGAALVTQPLVIMVLPILVFMAGKERFVGLLLRGAVPSVVLVLFPVVASFRQTVHVLVEQPNFPNLDHATPWTTFAPRISGHGSSLAVSAGPMRVVGIILACILGWRAGRWKDRPELLVWGFAAALALRCLTESVMTAFYAWPALAVGLVAAAALGGARLRLASGAAFFTTLTAQWDLGTFPWWLLQIAGLVALLVCAAETPTQRARRFQVEEYLRSRAKSQRATKRRSGSKPAAKRNAKRKKTAQRSG